MAPSSRTARGLTIPKRSSDASHSSPLAMSALFRPGHAHRPAIRDARARHQIDEHFGRARVDADNRDALSRRDRQSLEAERPESLVSLLDVGRSPGPAVVALGISSRATRGSGGLAGARLQIGECRVAAA